MANIKRTAMGKSIDMDMLRLANENTIAVGNARTNARGDKLGPGGKVIKTRAEVVQEYNSLNVNQPLVSHDEVDDVTDDALTADPVLLTPTVEHTAVDDASTTAPDYVKPRGSFADSVAQQTEVNQELLKPSGLQNGLPPKGPQRF